MALLLTSVFGVTGCGSDDDEAPVESRIKNSTGDDILDLGISNPGLSKMEQIKEQQEMEIDDLVKQTENKLRSALSLDRDDKLDKMRNRLDYIKKEPYNPNDNSSVRILGNDRRDDSDDKIKIPYELGDDDIKDDIDDDIDIIKDSIKCSPSTARISPNDSHKSLSKSFCE
jgi:hypothetical protein